MTRQPDLPGTDGQGLALADEIERALLPTNSKGPEQTDGAGREWKTTPMQREMMKGDYSNPLARAAIIDLDTAMSLARESEARFEAMRSERDLARLEAATHPVAISEEALARAICAAGGDDPDADYALPKPNMSDVPYEPAWQSYLPEGRACLALVAPELARCERERDGWKRSAHDWKALTIKHEDRAEVAERRVEELTREVELVREALRDKNAVDYLLWDQCEGGNVDLLKWTADKVDCGDRCEHGYTEWDTGAHVCHQETSEDGCLAQQAWQLRQLAEGFEAFHRVRAAHPGPSQAETQEDAI